VVGGAVVVVGGGLGLGPNWLGGLVVVVGGFAVVSEPAPVVPVVVPAPDDAPGSVGAPCVPASVAAF